MFRPPFYLSTLCPRYRDSPANGDPTSVLVNGTPHYLDKMIFFVPITNVRLTGTKFCPDNKDSH